MTHTAIEIPAKTVSEVLNAAVSFIGKLESAELLTGTPTVAEVTTTDLALSNKVVSTAALTISGVVVASGKAVQFAVSGGVAGVTYAVNVSCTTDSTPAQTLHGKVTFTVEAD